MKFGYFDDVYGQSWSYSQSIDILSVRVTKGNLPRENYVVLESTNAKIEESLREYRQIQNVNWNIAANKVCYVENVEDYIASFKDYDNLHDFIGFSGIETFFVKTRAFEVENEYRIAVLSDRKYCGEVLLYSLNPQKLLTKVYETKKDNELVSWYKKHNLVVEDI